MRIMSGRLTFESLGWFPVFLSRVIALVVLGVSILGKLLSPSSFIDFLLTAIGLPDSMIIGVAAAIIAVEATVFWLLVRYRETGIIAATALFGVFTMLIVFLHSSGVQGQCGCYGSFISSEIGLGKIIQNFSLTLLLFSSLVLSKASEPYATR